MSTEHLPGEDAELLDEGLPTGERLIEEVGKQLEYLNGIATDRQPLLALEEEYPEKRVHHNEGYIVVKVVRKHSFHKPYMPIVGLSLQQRHHLSL